MLLRMLLLVALLAARFAAEGVGDSALDRATLRGLKALNIIIDRVDPALVQEGLTAEALRTEIEGRLQSAGIRVDKSAVEFLGVQVMQARDKKGPYSIHLGLGVYQPVQLARDHNLRTATATWSAEAVLIAPPRQVVRGSLNTLNELAGQFAGAYRSVNPQ